MTETEWHACGDPQAMLDWLHQTGKLSERKARLLAVAVCRRVESLLPAEAFRQSLQALKRYADGEISTEEFDNGTKAVWDIAFGSRREKLKESVACAGRAVFHAIRREGSGGYHPDFARFASDQVVASSDNQNDERVAQATLLRDIINPFRSALLDPACRTPEVVSLAQRAYDDRDFSGLPALADLLEKQGCTDAELLSHLRAALPLRSGSVHVKGCWALDAVLCR